MNRVPDLNLRVDGGWNLCPCKSPRSLYAASRVCGKPALDRGGLGIVDDRKACAENGKKSTQDVIVAGRT
eukprot:5378128-Amphidinium_carterae.1